MENAPGPLLRPLSDSENLIARIAPGDAHLCRQMARLSRLATAEADAEAQALIASLDPLRQQLAQRTATQLLGAADAEGRLRFGIEMETLQDRIQSAGLSRILDLLLAIQRPQVQRLAIGRILHQAGAHTGTLRQRLGLPHHALKRIHSLQLRDRLMSLATLEDLQRRVRSSVDSNDKRSEAYQHAAMVNRRFGYSEARPAWSFTAAHRQDPVRSRYLKRLGRSIEAKRCGLNVQLP